MAKFKVWALPREVDRPLPPTHPLVGPVTLVTIDRVTSLNDGMLPPQVPNGHYTTCTRHSLGPNTDFVFTPEGILWNRCSCLGNTGT